MNIEKRYHVINNNHQGLAWMEKIVRVRMEGENDSIRDGGFQKTDYKFLDWVSDYPFETAAEYLAAKKEEEEKREAYVASQEGVYQIRLASLKEAIETSFLKEDLYIEKRGTYPVLGWKSSVRKVAGWAAELDRIEKLALEISRAKGIL